MKKAKTQRYVFYILILLTFSVFLYYFFSQPSNNSTTNEIINTNSSNFQSKLDGIQANNENDIKNPKISCPACNFTPLFPPSSTRRDVVLAAALNKLKRVETFLRTLRMTGSQCRIILFLDNKNTIEPHFLRFFKTCDIEPVYVNNSNNSILIGGAKMTRYYYYQQWLSLHINEVDRILHTDTFDVIFQSDPFRDDMLPINRNNESSEKSQYESKPILLENITQTHNDKTKNQTKILQENQIKTRRKYKQNYNQKEENEEIGKKDFELGNVLYFTFEPVSLGDSRWTASWVSQCYGPNILHKYRKMPVSCSGVTIGYGKAFLKYLNVMIGKNSWRRCFGDSLDQAHHNYVLYHGDLKDAGLKIKSLDCNSRFLTMHFCCKRGKCRLDEQTNIVYGNNTNKAPVLVHQYNRWKNLTRRNKDYCPGSAIDLFSDIFENKNMIDEAEIERLPPLNVIFPEKLS